MSDQYGISSYSNGKDKTIVEDHITKDIVDLLISKDGIFCDQVADFTNSLKGMKPYDQCYAIWKFLRDNVKYRPDSSAAQNLKSPARLVDDGMGDCKSFSLFIGCCLRNLGIPYSYRFVGFEPGDPTPTHVYIVAKPKGIAPVMMDAVLSRFDYEKKPYSYKKDVNMAVKMLTGFVNHNQGGVGKGWHPFKKLAAGIKKDVQKVETGVKKDVRQVQKTVQKAAHGVVVDAANAKKAVNNVVQKVRAAVLKFSPPTVLLREGMRIIFETNFANSAGKIGLGLLTPAVAQARGYDMTEWTKLHNNVQKMLSQFKTTWGGDPATLEKAIRTGFTHLKGQSLNGPTSWNAPVQIKTVAVPPGKSATILMHGSAAFLGQEPVSTGAAIAAAMATVLKLVSAVLADVDTKKMTAKSPNGLAEQSLNNPQNISPAEANALAAGANQYLQGQGAAPGDMVPNADQHIAAYQAGQEQGPGMATVPMSTGKKLLIGGGILTALIVGYEVMKD